MNRYVPALRAVGLTQRLFVRQLLTKGRVAALFGVGVIVSVVVVIVSRNLRDGSDGDTEEIVRSGVELMANLGFTMVVPIVALVFAVATFGDLKDDGTLVYLWLRPIDRWPTVVGAALAAVTVSLPVTLIPLTITALLADVGYGLVGATVLACVVGNLAYTAVFMLLGLLTKNAVSWGIGYILIWEGLVAGISNVSEHLAIRGYTRSIIAQQTGVDLVLGNLSLGVAIVVPALVVVGALVLSTLRLRSLDVA